MKDAGADIVDTPQLRLRRLRHLPRAQPVRDRGRGSVEEGGHIALLERRVTTHMLHQDDDVLALALAHTAPQGALARGHLREFTVKVLLSFLFPLFPAIMGPLRQRPPPHSRHNKLGRFLFNLYPRPASLVWFTLDSFNLE